MANKNCKKLLSVPTAAGPSTQPNPAEHSGDSIHTQFQATQTVAEEPIEQLQVEDEVTLVAEKLRLPLDDEVDDQESDKSDYYSDFEDD